MAQHEKFYLNGTWQLKKADETLALPGGDSGFGTFRADRTQFMKIRFYRMNEYPTRELLKNDFIFSKGI